MKPIVTSNLSRPQALIAPFPAMVLSLIETTGDDQILLNLEEHLRRRMDERNRLMMVRFEKKILSNWMLFFV